LKNRITSNQLEETYDKAMAEYERALGLNPNHADSRHNLGIIHLVKGNQQEALTRFQQAVQLQPNSACYRIDLALIYIAGGMLDEAAEQLLKVLEVDEPKEAYMNLIHSLITKAKFLGFCED
jgi:tetratricopeptide (TPR) repeat protein